MKTKLSDKWRAYRWKKILFIWFVFLLIALVLFVERSGVHYVGTFSRFDYLDKTEALPAESAMFAQPITNLLIYDSTQEGVEQALEQFDRILLDMKISTKSVDISRAPVPDYKSYETVMVLMPNVDNLGTKLTDLMDWVSAGGSALFAMTPVKTNYFDVIAPKLGVLASSWEYKVAESIVPSASFMLGGGQRYELSDPFESSLSVSLRSDAEVWAVTGDENVPLIWSNDLGEGRAVVCNIGIYGKVMRGFYAAAVSLLGDVCAYPVINGAVFYLDDFPSPVPGGDGTYISRDYGLSISDFYSKVWWPDILALAERYDIRYTGVMIENYEDDTESAPARQSDTQQFTYFGGLLLRSGGELGYHGYNHQPLCLPNIDYGDEYSYNNWPTEEAMFNAVSELIGFQKQVLPNTAGRVYVPPSNILSAEGRAMLGSRFDNIRTVASTYFGDGTVYPYVQEFGVAEDGIVEQPRIVSGGLMDDYMKLAAVSELNMHYVSTHFMHPDDLLDVDRGAAAGWAAYKSGLESYMKWLTASAPDIEMRTGSECSAAIQRWAQTTVFTETQKDKWVFTLNNFVDETWLFVRTNGAEAGRVSGGSLVKLTDDLYLLKAEKPTVTVERIEKRGG